MNDLGARESKKQRTRQAFFDAVLSLCLSGQGFSSISLRQVTREVGVVPTAFYRHFSDMEVLGKSLVEEMLGDTLAHLRELMGLGKVRTFDHQIAKSVQLFFQMVDKRPAEWNFLASERFGGSVAVRHAIDAQIRLFSTIMADDLGAQPQFAHISATDRYLLALAGVDLSFAWIVGWLDSVYLEDDEREGVRAVLLQCATRQMQMLIYGAYNWRSEVSEVSPQVDKA